MKKQYIQPTMKVVELKHQCQLLAGSAGGGAHSLSNNDDFTWNGDGFADSDVDY